MLNKYKLILHKPIFLIGFSIILSWIMIALFARVIAPYDPFEQNINNRLKPPSLSNFCGTDELGRDIFSRIIYGAQISLPMGFAIVVFSASIGCIIGALSGFFQGFFDEFAMRITDATLAFPPILLSLAISSILGLGLKSLFIAMTSVLWAEYARIMRGQVLSVKNQPFVEISSTLGFSKIYILIRHVIPNAINPIIIKATLEIGDVILTIAAMSFIGLGAVPPTPEWGAMTLMGRNKFYHWWMMTFPGLAILSVAIAFNFLGDELRDILER